MTQKPGHGFGMCPLAQQLTCGERLGCTRLALAAAAVKVEAVL